VRHLFFLWSSRRLLISLALGASCISLAMQVSPSVQAHPGHGGGGGGTSVPAAPLGPTPCVNGSAGGYPCARVNVESFLPTSQIGGGRTNDIWGWTDPATGKEYALVGRTNGTSFVDISTPGTPRYLGNLPTHSVASTWRAIKVFGNHAFIGSEAAEHGLQVFDLTQLRTVTTPPVTFTETAHYASFGRTHTLAVDEESGFLYAAGSNTCSGGLHMVDVHTPAAPFFAGCFSADRYTHEAQCVVYHGPDANYTNREICFNSNEDTLTIVDVTDKSAPVMLARKGYSGRGYTHQGWLTEDHRYFLLDDETDEKKQRTTTRTLLWNVSALTAPVMFAVHEGATTAVDHNQYVRGTHVFQANYSSGLRVLDISGVANGNLREIGFFDVRPEDDITDYIGAWSNFPFFKSGVVVVSSIERGLFVLRPTLAAMTRADLVVSALAAPPMAAIGLTVEVSDTTANQGARLASPSHTEFFLSGDGLFSADDVYVGERDVPTLSAGARDMVATTLAIPPDMPAGHYYLIAASDAHNSTTEDIENNNTRPRFISLGPDLTVSALTAPATAAAGASIDVADTVSNVGANTSGATQLRLFLSTNQSVDATDTELAAHGVQTIAAGQKRSRNLTVTIPSGTAPRVYYLVAYVDRENVVDEFVENNNTRAKKITIGAP
jgi:choice-of-anchor B domain-containing protein